MAYISPLPNRIPDGLRTPSLECSSVEFRGKSEELCSPSSSHDKPFRHGIATQPVVLSPNVDSVEAFETRRVVDLIIGMPPEEYRH